MAKEYDLVILGGGTGGYVAAIRASQLGIKTAIVEKDKLGGTCLHKGCIPSKALLRSAEVYATMKNSAEFGVETQDVRLNFSAVQQRKSKIVEQLYKGVQHLLKKGKIDIYSGFGRILGPSIFSPLPGSISVEMNGENEILIPKHVIIATGSHPVSLPGLPVDGKSVLHSDQALELETLPESIIIIGGGVIGIEWASLLADFGVDVTILEFQERIIPDEDHDISNELTKTLRKKGVRIVTNAKVKAETRKQQGETVEICADVDDQLQTFTAEKILVSVGRKANTENIGLQNTAIEMENGFIQVNNHMQTSESHIYAIGDVIGGLQLAHVASHEGIKAVEHIAGINNEIAMNTQNIPRCIYSHPEVASVGYSEQKARVKGYHVKIGKFPFKANGKALVYGESDGFVKVIADQETNDILGIHMIGPSVTNMISEAGLARVLDATPWEISSTVHPHPTLSETIGEAALAVDGLSIHI